MAKDTGQILDDAVSSIGDKLAHFNSGFGGEALDLRYGGLNGYLPNISKDVGGVMHGNYISNTPAVAGTVHAILLDYPKFFDFCGDEVAKILIAQLSEFVSSHSEVIDGINDSETLEFDDSTKIGKTGESIHAVTGGKLTPTAPVFTVTEKVGQPIRRLMRFIQRYGIHDVYSDGPLARTLPEFESKPWTSDMNSFSILVYELDETNTSVINAQIVINMKPISIGEYVLKKDINAGREVRRWSIPTTGSGIRGTEVIKAAQTYVDAMMKDSKDALLTSSLYSEPVSKATTDATGAGLSNSAKNL